MFKLFPIILIMFSTVSADEKNRIGDSGLIPLSPELDKQLRKQINFDHIKNRDKKEKNPKIIVKSNELK